MQSDWLRVFGPDLSNLCRNTANNIKFHYRKNQRTSFLTNSRDHFLGQFLVCFPPIFPPIPKNLALSHNFIRVSNTMPKLRNNQWSNSKKIHGQTDGQTEERADRPSFIESLRLPPGIQCGNSYYQKCNKNVIKMITRINYICRWSKSKLKIYCKLNNYCFLVLFFILMIFWSFDRNSYFPDCIYGFVAANHLQIGICY